MKKIILSLLVASFSLPSFSQSEDGYLHCGYNKNIQRLMDKGLVSEDYFERLQDMEEAEGSTPIVSNGSYQRGSTTIYIVPIVFHIIHAGGPENISNAQIYDALEILNKDYNKMNSDTSMVVATFSNNIANIGFEFRLAQKDALGNCTSGITRTFSEYTNGTDDQEGVKDVNRNLNNSPTNTSNIRFPRSKYLNVWIFDNLDGAAGYTTTPSGAWSATYDGIFIQDSYLGSIGTGSVFTSRALTHEVGHWFNLSHTWGNTNDPGISCGNDNVSDTPQTKGWTTCNLTGKSCTADPSPVDNVQNFMEYSYCSRMFTNGQKTRMVAAINSSTAQRSSLWTPQNVTAAGVDVAPFLCKAEFGSDRIVICEGESVTFEDQSYNGVTGWNWNFTGGTPSTSTAQHPTITYSTAGTYAVSLTADDGSNNDTETKTAYITVLPGVGTLAPPIMESFETTTSLPSNDWFVYNPDNGYAWDVTSSAAYTGSKSLKLQSASMAAGNLDEFVSNTYDLSGIGAVTVTFKYAFAQKSTSNTDILKVYVSNNCGDSWTLRKQISSSNLATSSTQSSQFTPSSTTQWQESQITNITSSYLTSNFRIKFSFESGGGNNLYIDDINITGPVGVEDLTYDFNLSTFPNPFDGNTTISFDLDNEKDTEVAIYDVIGKKVMVLANGSLSPGKHSYNVNGSELESGVYFVKLKAGNRATMKKIIVQH